MGFVDDYLAYLLARASHLVSRGFHAQLTARGVPVGEWRVLATLAGGRPLTVGELAARVLMKQPTVTKLVIRLEGRGLVRRTPVAGDRRKVHVHITEAGERTVAPLIAAARRHEAEVLEGLDEGEVAALKRALRHVIHRLADGEGRESVQRPGSGTSSSSSPNRHWKARRHQA